MATPFTVVLAGAEVQGRRAWRGLMTARPEFRVIGEAETGPHALELLDKLRPDLAVLGVHLDGLDGYGVLRGLPPRRWPRVLLYGHLESSLRAEFDRNRVEFLPIPLDEAQCRAALDRVAATLSRSDPTWRERMETALDAVERTGYVERIPVRHGGNVEIVEMESVDWIAAAGNYVELHSDGRRHLHRSALFKLARRLDPQRFVRIHRSVVVNVERVRTIEPTPQGDFHLRLDDGMQLRLSRRFRDALDRIAPQNRRWNGRA